MATKKTNTKTTKERYEKDAEITEAILDKTHPVQKEEQISNDTDKHEERGEGNV